MADALALAREITHPSASYPNDVWRAMRVAYCIHFRALLEFFHNGRDALAPNAKPPRPRDILVVDVLSPGKILAISPSARDKKRFRMADKLGAHLTRERTQYHAAKQEWGNAEDQAAIRKRIEALFAIQPLCARWFHRTQAELAKP
jgi:hypothetical protein